MPIDSHLHDQIVLSALDLDVGSSAANTICPFCNGGLSNDKSFSVTRYANVLFYRCWRVKCGEKGIIPTIGNYLNTNKKPVKTKEYYGTSSPLNDEDKAYLHNLWGLRDYELSSQAISKDDETADLVLPLYTVEGYDCGHLLRRLDGRKPKTLTFWSKDVPKVHFPLRKELTKSVFVVEDIPSAIKASRYMSAAALCGTDVGVDVSQHLSSVFNTIYLALDADATNKAIKYKNKYGLFFGNFFVVQLSKGDIKNLTDNDIDELMGGLLGETFTRSIS